MTVRILSDAERKRLLHVLETAPTPRQKQLIQMYYIENMTMPEIAEELGISVSSVSRTIKRGIARAKTYFS